MQADVKKALKDLTKKGFKKLYSDVIPFIVYSLIIFGVGFYAATESMEQDLLDACKESPFIIYETYILDYEISLLCTEIIEK